MREIKIPLFDSLAPLILLIVLACATAVSWLMLSRVASVQHGLYFLSVGQGDSQLIIFDNGVKMLIDGGPSGLMLLENLAAVLPASDRYIDVVAMTHPEFDHFNGLLSVLERFEVGVFVGNGRAGTSKAYQALPPMLREKGIAYVALDEYDILTIGETASIEVFAPSITEWRSKEMNDSSLVLMVQQEGTRALFTGDIGAELERRITREYDVSARILKVAHHGSRFSSDSFFLNEVEPDVAVIGVGKNNYGHPTKEALARMGDVTQLILRTDEDGLIKIVRGENGLEVFQVR